MLCIRRWWLRSRIKRRQNHIEDLQLLIDLQHISSPGEVLAEIVRLRDLNQRDFSRLMEAF